MTLRDDARRRWRRSSRYRPRTVTAWIVAVTVLLYVLQLLSGGALQDALQYSPLYSLPQTGAPFEPWRMLTSALIHQPISIPYSVVGIVHIGFNMYALYLFGRPLEQVLGGPRLLAIYVLGALGGSVAVLYLSFTPLLDPRTAVYGASGAVFAVLGAVAVVQRRLGLDVRALIVMIAINLALGFVVPGIAWQAHVGGLLVGALVGLLFVRNRGPRRDRRARIAAGAVGAVLVALSLAPAALL